MYYSIDKSIIRNLIDEEVSKVADEAYGENGASLYDSIVLTEKDDDFVDRLVDESVRGLVARTFDICKFAQNDTAGNARLLFYVPDFDETMESSVTSEINNFLALSVCAGIFQSRRPQAVQEYTERAKAAVEKAVTLLKSRKSPIAIW